MTIEELREVANRWRPKYSSVEAFERSWDRLHDWALEKRKRVSDMDVDRWMFDDLQRDEERAAGHQREPLLPVPSGASLVDCSHCLGLGFVRVEREPGTEHFGDAVRCPVCQGGKRKCGCVQCEWPSLTGDHRDCTDESGHDTLHPLDCPRCLACGVDQSLASDVLVLRPDGSVDYVATLLQRMRVRRQEEHPRQQNSFELAKANGFAGDMDAWAAVVSKH